MINSLLIDLISKASPLLGSALGGPLGSIVGSLISTALGGIDMSNDNQVKKALEDPEAIQKLKELELQLLDLQNARIHSEKEDKVSKFIRLFLVVIAHLALAADMYLITIVENQIMFNILSFMFVFMVWDIRQLYKFYFGSSNDFPDIGSFFNKKK